MLMGRARQVSERVSLRPAGGQHKDPLHFTLSSSLISHLDSHLPHLISKHPGGA